MNASKINYRIVENGEQLEITLPQFQTWDVTGIDEGYREYENDVLESLLNKEDFETERLPYREYEINGVKKTNINYDFRFNNAVTNTWITSYTPKFTTKQVYTFSPAFVNSFFKLDLYDTPNSRTQKNYITIIIPVRQGLTQTATVGVRTVEIKKPEFKLDYVGDREGFFIYWLKKSTFLDIKEFYMSAKFFDGSTGQFVRMVNKLPNTSSPTTINEENDFYYKVLIDNIPLNEPKKYFVEEYPSGSERGQEGNPIIWYEYINP